MARGARDSNIIESPASPTRVLEMQHGGRRSLRKTRPRGSRDGAGGKVVQGPGRWMKAAYSSAIIHGGTGAPALALLDGSKSSAFTTAEGVELEARREVAGEV